MDWLAFIPLHAIHIQHFNYFQPPRILFLHLQAKFLSKLNNFTLPSKKYHIYFKLVGKKSFRDHNRNILSHFLYFLSILFI